MEGDKPESPQWQPPAGPAPPQWQSPQPAPPQPPPPQWPPQPGPPWQQQQQPTWSPQPFGHAQPQSGKAIAALVLGIVGIVMCPIVCSIAALVTGYGGKREIDLSQGRIAGRGMAVAGIVLGWVGIGFWILFIAALVIAYAIDPAIFDEETTDGESIGVPAVVGLRVAGAVARFFV